tara:strand:- start:513 stop:812 length:300 start_codon:yes stop_codon:yes gene_type:complete
MKGIIVVKSFDSLGTDVIMDTTFRPEYFPDDFDIPGDDGYYYPKKHSKKKNKSARIRYENTKNPVVERPIPKHKKKKYPTKPKNKSKINKVKDSHEKYM